MSSATAPRIQISLKEQRKPMAAATISTSKAPPPVNTALFKSVRKALKNHSLNFKINVECTSLKLSPSGNFLWGGFSDGTLRVWDLSGTFGFQDDDVVASRQKNDVMVNSKLTQGFGAVACQIHARGVHTDLITTVDISDDAQYVFVGVARGAMELHAVFVGDLERAVHTHRQRERDSESTNKTITRNILDYIKVYCHSDAKLKGFGACATMRIVNNPTDSNSYMLLTGKGIKNIHIWKFTPPEHSYPEEGRYRAQSICDPPYDEEDHGIWEQLYDTSTNGNTIVLLGFYRTPQNKLLAVSKSDAQKLRLWDLSFEEEVAVDAQRPKRPPYKDVANSQSALEIAGGIGVCGGGNMYNEMSIVSLDRPDDPFNHTELALPSAAALAGEPEPGYSSRRQRRGEMKAVVNVATSPRDSSHALLELDDGSLIGYSAGSSSSSKDSSGSIPKLAIATPESTGIPALPADFWRRCICLANIAGVVIAASSLYNPNTNKGQLVIRALGGLKKPRGSEITEKKKKLRKERERLEMERKMLKKSKREQTENLPKTPKASHTNLQSSPVAADTKALRDAVSGPTTVPQSVVRTSKKASSIPNTSKQSLPPSTLTRVSPNGTMETPMHQKHALDEEDDSPDPTQGIPKISQFLQPKRINMPEKQQKEKSKKRKAGDSESTNAADASMFQLNSIGSIPFKSPKPQAKKQRKVGAPSKAKKSTSVPPIPFSTPNAARDASMEVDTRTSEDMSTALLLTELASPKPVTKTKAKPSETGTARKSKAVITPKVATKNTKSKAPSTKPKTTAAAFVPSGPSREEILHEKISEQYHQLRAFLKSITDRSMALIHSRNMRGPVPSALASAATRKDAAHVSAYSKLLAEHRAAHDYLQTRLLKSAETTLRLLLESRITAEEARTELKQSIKKFEEILCDTLHRQEMERLSVVTQYHGNFVRRRTNSTDESGQPSEAAGKTTAYPCKEAFDKVEDICVAITRPVGRPRSALAALR